MTRLVVLHGADVGKVVVLDAGQSLVVGRAVEGEPGLRLDDAELSKRHFRLSGDGGRFTLEDLGSRNGTFALGRRVTKAELRGQEIIRAGTTVLLFERAVLPPGATFLAETDDFPGPSLALGRVRAEIALLAPQRLPVLVLGETGVGKELVAEAVHRASGLTGPLLPVNCGAISPAVAESELFGHLPGAFTGAVKKSAGLFQAAHRGTLFLDEVGELPLELQAKLLRALAKGEVRSVGATEPEYVEVRVVAATHRELSAEVAAGRFREDLLARLSGWTVRVPPLRERAEDTLALARRFLGASQVMTADAAEALALHGWPQNVRELQATLEVAKVRAQGGPLKREHLPEALAARLLDRSFPGTEPPAHPALLPLEVLVPRSRTPSREELLLVLERNGGSVAETAAFFGKDRRQIYRWLDRFGIEAERVRGEADDGPPAH